MDGTATREPDWEALRARFHLPDGLLYLDGNSLGPMPVATPDRIARTLDEWSGMLIGGWNAGAGGEGWMGWPTRLGDRIGRLIGAPPGTTTVGDTLSIKVFQALDAALKMRPDRRVILSDDGNFPTDLYMAEGLIGLAGRDLELRVVAPDAVADAIA